MVRTPASLQPPTLTDPPLSPAPKPPPSNRSVAGVAPASSSEDVAAYLVPVFRFCLPFVLCCFATGWRQSKIEMCLFSPVILSSRQLAVRGAVVAISGTLPNCFLSPNPLIFDSKLLKYSFYANSYCACESAVFSLVHASFLQTASVNLHVCNHVDRICKPQTAKHLLLHSPHSASAFGGESHREAFFSPLASSTCLTCLG